MDNQTTDINEIIIRYLDGSASQEDKIELLQWLKISDKNWNDFNETRDLWLSCDVALGNDTDVNIALGRLRNRILNAQTPVKQSKLVFMRWYQVAAVFLVLLGMSYWFTIQTPEPAEKETQIHIQNQLITAKGSKGKFLLPDGTTVWLNTESKLIYPEKFDNDKRLVRLEGEGYFEVVENKHKPFIVQSGNLDIEVLGTTFDIAAYPEKDKIDVVLLNGSVKVMGETLEKEVLLKPNQILEYQKNEGTSNIRNTKAYLHAAWIEERLIFDNTPLSDIIISLEGWYNISIECPRTLAEKTRMTFTVRGENVEEIFKAMSLIAPIRYSIENDKVTINPK